MAHKSKNDTDLKVGFISTIAAFFSASGGASIGQYGPLVHFGTTLGAWLKKTIPFNFTPDLYTTLLSNPQALRGLDWVAIALDDGATES